MIFFITLKFYLLLVPVIIIFRFLLSTSFKKLTFHKPFLLVVNIAFLLLLANFSLYYFFILSISTVLAFFVAKHVLLSNHSLKKTNSTCYTYSAFLFIFISFFVVYKFPLLNSLFSKMQILENSSWLILNNKFIPFLGLSYAFLKILHFLFEVKAENIKKLDFFTFLNFIFFFPTYLAGPIDKYERFNKDLMHPQKLNYNILISASTRIIVGMLKKAVLAVIVAPYAISSLNINTSSLLVIPGSLYLYSILIYLDFSGYSDLAIGTSKLFGINVPENFYKPYSKRNLIEFWNSWHISLTSWLKDYVFLRIGQKCFRTKLKKKPLSIASISYIITFCVCGLWHGITVNFLLWGLYHGIGLAICKWFTQYSKMNFSKSYHKFVKTKAAFILSIFLTFNYVSFGWLFFVLDISKIKILLSKLIILFG